MAFHHLHDIQAFYQMHYVKRLPTGPHTPWWNRAEMGVRLFKNFLLTLVVYSLQKKPGLQEKMRYSFFTAMRRVTATNPMIAIQNAHAFDPSCSNQLMVANQKAHAFRPNSIVAKKRMPRSLVGTKTKMISASSTS